MKSKGEIAYEAFITRMWGHGASYVNHRGDREQCARWTGLSPEACASWEAAARAVTEAVHV